MHNSRNDDEKPCIKSSAAVKSKKMYIWAEETFTCTTLLTLALRCWAEQCQILSPCCYLLSFSPGHLLHMTASFTCNKYNDCSWLCIFFPLCTRKTIAALIHNVSIHFCHVHQPLSIHSLCCFIQWFYTWTYNAFACVNIKICSHPMCCVVSSYLSYYKLPVNLYQSGHTSHYTVSLLLLKLLCVKISPEMSSFRYTAYNHVIVNGTEIIPHILISDVNWKSWHVPVEVIWICALFCVIGWSDNCKKMWTVSVYTQFF